MTVGVFLWSRYVHDTYEERGEIRSLCDDYSIARANRQDEVPEGYEPCPHCVFFRSEGPAFFTDDDVARIDAFIEVLKTEHDRAKLGAALWEALRGHDNWRHRHKAIGFIVDRCQVSHLKWQLNTANYEAARNIPEFEPYIQAIYVGRNTLPKRGL